MEKYPVGRPHTWPRYPVTSLAMIFATVRVSRVLGSVPGCTHYYRGNPQSIPLRPDVRRSYSSASLDRCSLDENDEKHDRRRFGPKRIVSYTYESPYRWELRSAPRPGHVGVTCLRSTAAARRRKRIDQFAFYVICFCHGCYCSRAQSALYWA